MIRNKINRFSILVLVCITAVALLALPACGRAAKEKAVEKVEAATEKALDAIEKGAEIAGKATANWLGTTAGNIGKNFNETITERLSYLEISIDSITSETEDEIESYTLDITINNTAPDDEKIYINVILSDNYLVACDQDDYTYKFLVDKDAIGYSDNVKPGKSRYTITTDLPEADKLGYLLFIGEKIDLP